MSGIERFEEIVAWQKARALTKSIYLATRQATFARDFGLASQIQRASTSIMANIAEGFERNSSAEFHQFLSIAKASCSEVRSHLYTAFDVGYIDQVQFDQLRSQAEETAKVIGGLRAAVAQRRDQQRSKR